MLSDLVGPGIMGSAGGLENENSSTIKQQIVDMAMNASGIRDTARVLHVSPTTVIKELKNGSVGRSRHL